MMSLGRRGVCGHPARCRSHAALHRSIPSSTAPYPARRAAGRGAAVAARAQTPAAQPTPLEAPAAPAQPPAAAELAPEAVASLGQQPYGAPAPYPQHLGMAPRPEAYYVAQPPGPPMYPAHMYQPRQEASSPIPWWVWMGAGILVANVARVVQDFMKKGPQQFMAEMAMKQMMKGMTPPGATGASPFGAGASPFGAPGASPFGAYGNSNPFSPNFQPPAAPVDTTATPVGASQAAAAAGAATAGAADSTADGSRGERFAARRTATGAKDKDGGAASNGAGAAAATAAAAAAASAPPAMDVVEPEVKEPESKKAASFFQDVGGSDAGSSSTTNSAEASSQMATMLESMLKDPNLQQMLYPYLPEPMRNPDSIEWILKTPEVRKQMETMFAQSNMSMNPQMLEMMKQMDFSQEKVQEQFNALGLKPEDVMQKVMSTPDLAAGFANPKVQQAIFDISQNPMNITKYQNDPEVMKVLNKVTEVFNPSMSGQP